MAYFAEITTREVQNYEALWGHYFDFIQDLIILYKILVGIAIKRELYLITHKICFYFHFETTQF